MKSDNWPLPKYSVSVYPASRHVIQYWFYEIFNFPESHAVPYNVSRGPKSLQMLAIHHSMFEH